MLEQSRRCEDNTIFSQKFISSFHKNFSKVFNSNFAINSRETNSRFSSQLLLIKQADNRYISAFIEQIGDKSAVHIITEIPDGVCLRDYIAENGPMTRDKTQDLIGKLLFIQKYLSSKLGLKYCEFNPNTIFIDPDGYLSRFCIPFTKPKNDPYLTLFDPPEIFHLNKPSTNSDSWSIGMIVYLCVTGNLPFDCKTSEEVIKKILNDKITIPPSLPDDTSIILTKTLVKNPLMRMSLIEISASEFLATFTLDTTDQRNERRASANSVSQPRRSPGTTVTRSQSEVNKHMVHLSYKANISNAKRLQKKTLGNLG